MYYIVNKNKDSKGYNEVHITTCAYRPDEQNQYPLGWHDNAKQAVTYAKSIGYSADGCYYCCPDAHHG